MNLTQPTQKTAIVTGGSRGIGEAIAIRLARDGFDVVINYASNRGKADQVVRRIQEQGGCALAVQGDVAEVADVQQLFEQAQSTFGGVDVVVNSAGIMNYTPIAEGNLAEFDKMIRTNLRGTYVVLAEPAKNVRGGGRIIGMSTSVIAKALPTYGAYIASKAGVEGLVHVLANELHGHNITVNAVAPGPVATDLFLHGKTEAQIEQLSKLPPLERLGTPEDIANVVSFLAGRRWRVGELPSTARQWRVCLRHCPK